MYRLQLVQENPLHKLVGLQRGDLGPKRDPSHLINPLGTDQVHFTPKGAQQAILPFKMLFWGNVERQNGTATLVGSM